MNKLLIIAFLSLLIININISEVSALNFSHIKSQVEDIKNVFKSEVTRESIDKDSNFNDPNQPVECYDTDGGLNYISSGSLSTLFCNSTGCIAGEGVEGCENETLLIEGYCDEEGNMKFIQYPCPNGCANACLY